MDNEFSNSETNSKILEENGLDIASKNIDAEPTNDADYQNFFNMLKFWIEQTRKNINDEENSPKIRQITKNTAPKAEKVFVDPNFISKYLDYDNFHINIRFKDQGDKCKGIYKNFVSHRPDDINKSGWIAIRYNFDSEEIYLSYNYDDKNNSDSPEFKEYMKDLGYKDKGLTFNVSELDLESYEPNEKVRELFDNFCKMIKQGGKFMPIPDPDPDTPVTISDLLKLNNKEKDIVKRLLDKEQSPYNVILRGAPGTGKTYSSKKIAAAIIGLKDLEDLKGHDQYEFVQFHPSYDYTDFVEGLRPTVGNNTNNNLGFELKAGIFKDFCESAKDDTSKNYVFVIDEINRGEISKILGELFFSIDPDYRGTDGEITTQYANLHSDTESKFYIPKNVYIIGTMNDIDRSVDTFDFAMRRRFTFIEITAKESQSWLDEYNKYDITIALMDAINNKIFNDTTKESKVGLNKDYQIGASYFKSLAQSETDEIFEKRKESLWENKLEPLFKDYFRGESQAQEYLDILKVAYDAPKEAKNEIPSNTDVIEDLG